MASGSARKPGVSAVAGEAVVEAIAPAPDLKRVFAVPDGVPVIQLYRAMKQDTHVVAGVEVQLPADLTAPVFRRPQLAI